MKKLNNFPLRPMRQALVRPRRERTNRIAQNLFFVRFGQSYSSKALKLTNQNAPVIVCSRRREACCRLHCTLFVLRIICVYCESSESFRLCVYQVSDGIPVSHALGTYTTVYTDYSVTNRTTPGNMLKLQPKNSIV